MASLQDQLLKAGMVNAQKVKQVKKEKRKQSKRVRHGEVEPVDEVKQAARAMAARASWRGAPRSAERSRPAPAAPMARRKTVSYQIMVNFERPHHAQPPIPC